MTQGIYITETDRERLKERMETELLRGKTPDQYTKKLEQEINKATIVSSEQIPQDVITMNSRVRLQIDGEDAEISLVYPEDADWSANKMSILSPIGTAILGYRTGNVIDWKVPSGVTRILIKEILYQPEAAGDFG